MATEDMYLEVPGINGESTIEILSFSHGVSDPAVFVRHRDVPTVSELTITKKTDASSTGFYNAVAGNTNLGTGTLIVTNTDGATTTFTYTNLIVLSIVSTGNIGGGGDNPVESVILHFGQSSITYSPPQGATG